MKSLWLMVIPVVFALSACEQDIGISPAPPTDLEPAGQSLLTEVQFLPYGVPAPDPLPPNLIPEPYNPKKHGPPRPNSTPQLNLPEHERPSWHREALPGALAYRCLYRKETLTRGLSGLRRLILESMQGMK